MPIVLIDNADATLLCYPEDKIIHHQFHRLIFGDAFREVMAASAKAFEQYGCHKYLSDDRENSALRPDNRIWGDANFTPKVIKAGWTHWALVMPRKIIGQLNMKHLVDEYRSMGVVVEVFNDPDEAMTWLKAQ